MHNYKRLALNLNSPTLTLTPFAFSLRVSLYLPHSLSSCSPFLFLVTWNLFSQSLLLNSKKRLWYSQKANTYIVRHCSTIFFLISQILLGDNLFLGLCERKIKRESATSKILPSSLLCRCLVCEWVGVYVYDSERNWTSSPSWSYNHNST